MFSVVSVCLVGVGGVPCYHYLWCIRCHHTENHPPQHLDMFKLGLHCTGTSPSPDMFNLDLTVQEHTLATAPQSVQGPPSPTHPQTDMFKLVYYEAPTVGKRVVGILLEYFLVTNSFGISRIQEKTPVQTQICKSSETFNVCISDL